MDKKPTIFSAIRALLVALVLAAGFVLPGCGTVDAPTDTNSRASTLKIITTVFAPYDFSRQIAGEDAEVSMLLPPGAESHSFEPTPRDLINIQNCDLFIYIGGESETWVSDILASMDQSKMRILRLMDSVTVLDEEVVEGMEGDEPGEPDYDEHIWTSPRNATLMVKAIAAALEELRPANASEFQRQAAEYLAELSQLDSDLRHVVSQARRDTLVFGDRFPFLYLTKALGLHYYAAFPGCSSESEPKPATVAFLISKVRAERLPVVLKVEMSSPALAETIAEEAGAEVRTLHSLHNLSRKELEAGETYLSLMRGNVAVLKEALG